MPGPLQALEVLKLLQAGAGLVLVFALAERLRSGGGRGEGLAGTVALAVASGSIGAALLLASGGVGYATLTLYELFPQAEEAPGASSGPVSVVSSALNAVVSGLGNAAVFASGLGFPQRLGRPAHGPPLALAERPDASLGGGRGAGLRLPRPGQPDPRPEPDRPGLAGGRPLAPAGRARRPRACRAGDDAEAHRPRRVREPGQAHPQPRRCQVERTHHDAGALARIERQRHHLPPIERRRKAR